MTISQGDENGRSLANFYLPEERLALRTCPAGSRVSLLSPDPILLASPPDAYTG